MTARIMPSTVAGGAPGGMPKPNTNSASPTPAMPPRPMPPSRDPTRIHPSRIASSSHTSAASITVPSSACPWAFTAHQRRSDHRVNCRFLVDAGCRRRAQRRAHASHRLGSHRPRICAVRDRHRPLSRRRHDRVVPRAGTARRRRAHADIRRHVAPYAGSYGYRGVAGAYPGDAGVVPRRRSGRAGACRRRAARGRRAVPAGAEQPWLQRAQHRLRIHRGGAGAAWLRRRCAKLSVDQPDGARRPLAARRGESAWRRAVRARRADPAFEHGGLVARWRR